MDAWNLLGKTSEINEDLIDSIGKIAHKMNKIEMENKDKGKMQRRIKKLIKKDIKKIEYLLEALEMPKIDNLWENPHKMGELIINELLSYNLETSGIRRNFHILCLRMAAIVDGLDMRRGKKYAWNPKNGKRTVNVANKYKIKNKKRLTYPLRLGDCMLWFPGMIRTTSYINVLKSGDIEVSWKGLIGELDRFHKMEEKKDIIHLKAEELKRMRQFWSTELL